MHVLGLNLPTCTNNANVKHGQCIIGFTFNKRSCQGKNNLGSEEKNRDQMQVIGEDNTRTHA